MQNFPVFRLILAIVLSFCVLSHAQADIASDVREGKLSLQQIAKNALASLSPPDVVRSMIAAGVNPILSAEAVAQNAPADAAPGIAAAATSTVPDAAADIAAAVARVMPAQALNIALAAGRAAPDMAPEIAASVAEVTPASAAGIAAGMARVVPRVANEIADSVSKAVPESTTEIHLAVLQALPPTGAGPGAGAGAGAGAGTAAGVGGGGGGGVVSDCNAATVGATKTTPTNIFVPADPPPPLTKTIEDCLGPDIRKRTQTFRNRKRVLFNYVCEFSVGSYHWKQTDSTYGPTEQVLLTDTATITKCAPPTTCTGTPPACVCPPGTSQYKKQDGSIGCQ